MPTTKRRELQQRNEALHQEQQRQSMALSNAHRGMPLLRRETQAIHAMEAELRDQIRNINFEHVDKHPIQKANYSSNLSNEQFIRCKIQPIALI